MPLNHFVTLGRSGGIDEKAFTIIGALIATAQELDTSPARVALSWVQGAPGVTSTIIGARTLDQLEQNLGGLEVKLSEAQRKKLDDLSTPALNFPAPFLTRIGGVMHPGISVNGELPERLPFLPKPGDKTW